MKELKEYICNDICEVAKTCYHRVPHKWNGPYGKANCGDHVMFMCCSKNSKCIKMETFEIWSEGYRATGEDGTASFHGKCEGRTFKEACKNFAKKNKDFIEFFDPKDMDYCGCRLFDNESDARESFG